jgi:hypothetical protein
MTATKKGGENMDKFWELLRESVIVQSLVTLLLVGTLCYMFVTGTLIPELLTQITLLVIGFWFGSKSQQAMTRNKRGG